MTDLERVITAARHFEGLLWDRYRAQGSGLATKTRSVENNLREEIVNHLLYVAQIRNEFAHQDTNELTDRQKFEHSCQALETFFRDSVPRAEVNPQWIEPCQIRRWPLSMESSKQKRLYIQTPGNVIVYSSGIHKINRLRDIKSAGYILMVPQSLPSITMSGLRSSDQFDITMYIETSAVVIDTEEAIINVIISPDQQIDALKTRM